MALVLNQKGKKVKLIFRIVDEGLSINLADETDQVIYQVSSEHERAILNYLLERAGLVAITLEENKDRIVMRNNHEGFVEEIVGLNAQLKKVSESAAPVKAKSRVVEINWGEEEAEDMFVHVGSKDLPDGSREDIYELYSEEKHGDVETWTRAAVLSMNDHMLGRDKAVIRESVQTPVRTEQEIQEPPTPVLMVEARLETLEKSITFRKEALANLSEDLYSSRITYLVELRAMDMLKTSLTSLLEDLEELAESDGMIRQMDLSTKNDF